MNKKMSFSMELAKECIDIYQNVSKVAVSIIDGCGNQMYCPSKELLSFCNCFQKAIDNEKICIDFHLSAGEKSFQFGEALMLFCPAGLVQWVSPIVNSNDIKAYLVGGPVLLLPPDEYIFENIRKKHKICEFAISELADKLDLVPVIEVKKARYYAELLNIIADYVSVNNVEPIHKKREFYNIQSRISEEIHELKRDSRRITDYYPLEKEKQLINMVKVGDKNGAKTILNELLGEVLFKSGGNFEYIKSRALELTVVLSRAAVEGGANLKMVFGLNLNYLQQIGEIGNVEELCFWLIRVLDRFMECVSSIGLNEVSGIIKKSISYMEKHYKENISLQDVAKAVYLNPSYFSKLFKEQTGIRFIDYLNKIRVEQSKKYLRQLDMNISEVALNSGFCDQSYYTRVFKGIEGITPGKWRNMMAK
jgi:two-component system response regulator YesN